MPVLIEEMTVQIEVSQARTTQGGGSGNNTVQPDASAQKTDLIKACVAEVMEVIRHQNER